MCLKAINVCIERNKYLLSSLTTFFRNDMKKHKWLSEEESFIGESHTNAECEAGLNS